MSITVSGLAELFTVLERAAAVEVLEPPMQRSLLRLEAYMKFYPRAPEQSRYVRTGTLGRRWTTAPLERTGNGLIGKIGNNVPYAPFVQSSHFQTRTHARTGWRTDEDAVRENEAAIVNDFRTAIEVAVRG